ncbi:hypothetical protein [Arcanobacterium phocae]|uniref:hypothetical protein n=1 Tax=Arcanobacterium phocae TaxID=131112 RepID=UPI001C0FC1C7|nr:hypothetical protein [Arcanobacterium phocae]
MSKEKAKLEQELKALEETPITNNIADLVQKLDEAKQQLADLKIKLQDAEKRLKILDAAYGEALAAKEAQSEKVAAETRRVEKLRNELAQANADLEAAQNELDQAHKDHDSAVKAQNSLTKQITETKEMRDHIADSSAELDQVTKELDAKRILHSESVKTEKEQCATKHPAPMAPTPAPAQPIQKTAPASVQNKASGQLAHTGVAPEEALLGAGALIGLGALAAGVSRRRRQA